jgi:hypothetical protein
MATAQQIPAEREFLGLPRGDLAKIVVGGAVALVCGRLASFNPEQWIYLGIAAVFAVGLWLISRSRKMAVQSELHGANKKPYERMTTGNPWFRRVGFVLCTASFCAILFWYFFGPQLVPSASITNFEMSDIRYTYGSTYKGRIIVPNEFYDNDDDGPILATPCVLLTVCIGQFRTNSVIIESLDFQVKPIPFKTWQPRKGVYPLNAIIPYRFSATLKPGSPSVKARVVDDNGNPDQVFIPLDATRPFAVLHVQFDGITGLYDIVPIITITDGHGRNRTQVTYRSDGLWPAAGVLEFPGAEKLKRL